MKKIISVIILIIMCSVLFYGCNTSQNNSSSYSNKISKAQEKTLKFDETKTDGKLYDTCNFITYENIPYITLNVSKLTLNFEIPEKAYDYINEL